MSQGYRPTRMNHLIDFQPAEAEKVLTDAFFKAGGNLEEAGKLLGVTRQTFSNYLERLGIEIQRTAELIKMPTKKKAAG